MSADKAYMEIYERAFPDMDSDAEESDYKHFVSPPSLMDEGHIFFLVESGDSAKLIYGFKRDTSSVIEVVMRRGEFQSVVRGVIDRWKASSL
ncbi:Imm42 family immunity protein [Ralstonia syzygii]|uniref:Imm42 family immunity protein n=1 Tax=Ralstonia syzygii TaxID=28097 RepID=UPI0036F2FCF1